MGFTTKAGNLKQLKSMIDRSSGSGVITFIGSEPMVVRFLEEPIEWRRYQDCWDDAKRRSFPFVEWMEEGVDYTSIRWRYLVNAVDVNAKDPKRQVIALQIPISLMESVVARYERYGTMLDRDYEILKLGKGKDNTKYEIAPADDSPKRDLSKYQPLDIEAVLQDAYERAFPKATDESPKTTTSRREARPTSSRASDEPDEESDDEEPDEEGFIPNKVEMMDKNEWPWPNLCKYARSVGVANPLPQTRSKLVAAIIEERG